MATATTEEVLSAFEDILSEMSIVDVSAVEAQDYLGISLSDDIGLHRVEDFEALSRSLAEKDIEISAETLEELDTVEAVLNYLVFG
jgi:hypothetical protein